MKNGKGDKGLTHAVRVARVAAEEHAVVERVPLGDALADRVDRIPLDALPLDPVRAQDLLGRLLDLLCRRRLARVEVRVRRLRQLDVQPHHPVLPRDHHDRAVL